ncbi:unnamed protein product, partial [Staurois parvus]
MCSGHPTVSRVLTLKGGQLRGSGSRYLFTVSGHLLTVCSLWSSPVLYPQSLVIPVLCPQSLVISCTVSAVSGHPLYCVRSLWSSPVLCPQSLVISCTMSAVSGHLLYYVRSLWSSPVLSTVSGHLLYCPQSLVISCIMSAVSGPASPVLCLQSLVISCTMSAVSGHLLYYVRSLWSSP